RARSASAEARAAWAASRCRATSAASSSARSWPAFTRSPTSARRRDSLPPMRKDSTGSCRARTSPAKLASSPSPGRASTTRAGRGGLVTIAGAGCQGQQARQDKSTENQGFGAHRGRSQLLNCRYTNFTQPESSIIMSAMSRPARNPTPPGRPKDLEKRAAILDAAKTLFPERGYEGTSMDAIAQAAGVSKLTVYSHFQDKDTLFVEAVKAKCEELLPQDLFV